VIPFSVGGNADFMDDTSGRFGLAADAKRRKKIPSAAGAAEGLVFHVSK
jgi:hypothetical protein